MMTQNFPNIKLINNSFTKRRGGKSILYEITCSECAGFICLYQKDGPGQLKRMYFDRIHFPPNFISQLDQNTCFQCSICKIVFGTKMVYKKDGENRSAIRLYQSSVKKTQFNNKEKKAMVVSNNTNQAIDFSQLSEEQIVAFSKKTVISVSKKIQVIENGKNQVIRVTRKGVGPLETEYGDFWHYVFHLNDEWETYHALVKSKINFDLQPVFLNPRNIKMRTDSGCQTAQVFRDRTCDCDEQLRKAMDYLNQAGEGLIINIPHQDGRGQGLAFKLGTMSLQKYIGMDTVRAAMTMANVSDPMKIDVRTYAGIPAILKFFGIMNCEVNLATNNPLKTGILTQNGYSLTTTAIKIEATEQTKRHFLAKQEFLGHSTII